MSAAGERQRAKAGTARRRASRRAADEQHVNMHRARKEAAMSVTRESRPTR